MKRKIGHINSPPAAVRRSRRVLTTAAPLSQRLSRLAHLVASGQVYSSAVPRVHCVPMNAVAIHSFDQNVALQPLADSRWFGRTPPQAVGATSWLWLSGDLPRRLDVLASQGERPLLGAARSGRFSNDYFDQPAKAWGDGAALLATSHQLVDYRK